MEKVADVPHRINGETLINLSFVASFVISLAGSVYFIAQVSAQSNANTTAIEELHERRSGTNVRMYDRMNLIDDKVSDIKAEVSGISAKIDLLIELRSSDKARN